MEDFKKLTIINNNLCTRNIMQLITENCNQ